jgi:hypothetical protein
MTPDESLARNRYYMMMAVNMGAVAGAVFGLVLAGRSHETWQTILGAAIVLSALYVMAVVPRAMAHKWRTPPEA